MALFDDGRRMVYGTMGGEGQPQTQSAIFSRYAMFGQKLQAAVTAPRWLLGKTWGEETMTLKLESRFDPALIARCAMPGTMSRCLPRSPRPWATPAQSCCTPTACSKAPPTRAATARRAGFRRSRRLTCASFSSIRTRPRRSPNAWRLMPARSSKARDLRAGDRPFRRALHLEPRGCGDRRSCRARCAGGACRRLRRGLSRLLRRSGPCRAEGGLARAGDRDGRSVLHRGGARGQALRHRHRRRPVEADAGGVRGDARPVATACGDPRRRADRATRSRTIPMPRSRCWPTLARPARRRTARMSSSSAARLWQAWRSAFSRACRCRCCARSQPARRLWSPQRRRAASATASAPALASVGLSASLAKLIGR